MLDFIAVPLGWIIKVCYSLVDNYFLALLLFAIVMQILLLYFSIKQQKNSVQQAKLAPKTAAIRKKYAGRNDAQTQQKMQIARQALALVERGTTLFLDSSTTVYQLARILPTDMDLTVITNSIRVGALMTQKKIRTYILGGLLNDGFYSTGGTYAVEMAKQLRVDVMFFSANALTYEGEIMDFSENEARLRQEIIARSERT